MKSAVLVVVGSVLLGGCGGHSMEIVGNMRYLYSHDINALSPSLTIGTVQECVKEEGYHEVTRIDDKLHHCYGQYVTRAYPYAGQKGYLDIGGVVEAGIYGTATVIAADKIGDGLTKSGSKTSNINNTSGGTANSSSLGVGTGGSATSAAQGGAGGNGYGFGGAGGKGGSVNYGKHRR